MTGDTLRRLVDAGVELEVYHLSNFARANHRTHRKLLVIDGRIGFTGGVGIADEWDGDARSAKEWRDSHYRVEEPVVAQMRAAFLDNWMKTRAVMLHGEEYFPALQPVGRHRCQMFKSSPMEGRESARLMYLLAITAAERTRRVGNAYFVLDDLTSAALVAAVERGMRIFEFEPTMYHCEVMVIDDLWTSVGSANFDNRPFRLNDEANLNVLDRDIAAGATRVFQEDLSRSREVTHREWLRRPAWQQAADAGAALLRSQL